MNAQYWILDFEMRRAGGFAGSTEPESTTGVIEASERSRRVVSSFDDRVDARYAQIRKTQCSKCNKGEVEEDVE